MKKNTFLYVLVRILIWCFIVIGTLLAVWMVSHSLPYLIGRMENGTFYATLAVVLAILFYAGALCIAINLLLMMASLKGDPFVKRNVISLRIMGFTALGMTGCSFFLLLIPVNAFIFLAAGLAVGLCGLLALVLAEVFDRAVAYKQENDLTI